MSKSKQIPACFCLNRFIITGFLNEQTDMYKITLHPWYMKFTKSSQLTYKSKERGSNCLEIIELLWYTPSPSPPPPKKNKKKPKKPRLQINIYWDCVTIFENIFCFVATRWQQNARRLWVYFCNSKSTSSSYYRTGL